jgi:arylsulfatase A-like enzyme
VNLILIVSDTLRADYLGCYGSEWVRTPNLDSLASRSVVFDAHHAASFPTLPARADFFLGKWTFTYRGWEPVPPEERTLAALLAESGYRTAGVVDTPFYTIKGYAYDRGFLHFADLDSQRVGGPEARNQPQLIRRPRTTELDYAAPRTFLLAEQYLEQLYEGPFFLLVDTWDPHEPWDPPRWYVEPYLPGWDGRIVRPPYRPFVDAGLTEDDITIARATYAGEISMVDRWIGRLVERIESLGIADETVVAFTSDHGFYFGEHGFLGKLVAEPGRERPLFLRSPLYREITRVPLIISAPGCEPHRVGELTSAIDIMPTLLDLADVPKPEGLHGRSLAGMLRGSSGGGREFVVTSPPLANPGDPIRVVDDEMRYVGEYLPATVTTPDWTLIHADAATPVELYHLPSDPGQERDCSTEFPDVARELTETYLSLLTQVGTAEEYMVRRRS